MRHTIASAPGIVGAALAAVLCMSGTAAAQPVSAEDIVRALSPPPAQPVTRSFRPVTRGIDVEPGQGEAPPPPRSIDLEVNFEFDQSAITMSDARFQLDALGRALKDAKLSGLKFKIIGHTDGKGADAYNLDLSRRRAAAVRAYLHQFHQVPSGDLEAEGRGPRELKDRQNPLNAINRRVEVRSWGIDLPPPSPVPAPPPIARVDPPSPPPSPPPVRPHAAGNQVLPELEQSRFPTRPVEHVGKLPDRPVRRADDVAAASGRVPDRDERVLAFSSTPYTAAAMFARVFALRVPRSAATITTDSVVAAARSALVQPFDGSALTAREALSRLALANARAEVLTIAAATRILDERFDFDAQYADQGPQALTDLFQRAVREVILDTRSIGAVLRLKASADNLVVTLNHLSISEPNAELASLAADRAKAVLQTLSAEVPALLEAERDPSAAGALAAVELRHRLVDCVTLRLPGLLTERAQTPATSSVLKTDGAGGSSSSPVLSLIVTDASQNCASLSGRSVPSSQVPSLPLSPLPRTQPMMRKAGVGTEPIPFSTDAVATIAGQPLD